MPSAIDLHIAKRLRRRRRLLGIQQQKLAEMIGLKNGQQIQKYECGANRVTASRLYELAVALNVPVNYFFEGFSQTQQPANDPLSNAVDAKEAAELVRLYSKLGERPRRRLMDTAKALQDQLADTG